MTDGEITRCRHALTYCDECHAVPRTAIADADWPRPDHIPPFGCEEDVALLDYAASCYESSDLDDPSGVVLRIVLPPNAGVTGDLRRDLRAALGLSSRGARS